MLILISIGILISKILYKILISDMIDKLLNHTRTINVSKNLIIGQNAKKTIFKKFNTT